ncbi:glutamate-cysteine ligase family protein [Oligoflexaceae bacterium]|nr:glutamate-cysteine ligase family protein [Oligoflexaceae bacterium]
MGEGVKKTKYDDEDFERFAIALKSETEKLKTHRLSSDRQRVLGLELETWLVDHDGLPTAANQKVLKKLNHELLVPELSKFNLELNSKPLPVQPRVFNMMHQNLDQLWKHVQRSIADLDCRMLMVGTLPTLRDTMLGIKSMSEVDRYYALNHRVFEMRSAMPVRLQIEGNEKLIVTHRDIMLEAAATSLQIHLQVPQDEFAATFNASLVGSFALVASSANSPFLFGKDLWHESRIPVFEQAVDVFNLELEEAQPKRVTFGRDYLRDDWHSLFEANLNDYQVLLPETFDEGTYRHLKFHNGNIWRWIRPIVGEDSRGDLQLRVEQRTLPAGPTTIDVAANIAFYVGLTTALAKKDPDALLKFSEAAQNFYQCCRKGLQSKINWRGRKDVSVTELICEELLPLAEQGLHSLDIDAADIKLFLHDVIYPRVTTGRNGANWQRSYIHVHKGDFKGLVHAYFEGQESGEPVHTWTV